MMSCHGVLRDLTRGANLVLRSVMPPPGPRERCDAQTAEAGFMFCCPPPCVAAVGALPCPTAADPCYAWDDFYGECPAHKT